MDNNLLIEQLKKASHVQFAIDTKFEKELELRLRSKFPEKSVSIFPKAQKSLLEGLKAYIKIPLVGSVACGRPLLAEENVEKMVPVPVKNARPPHEYFILRAKGDSMNLAGINDGELVLIRQQNYAENGSKVVALIDDEATIKEIHMFSDRVELRPRSSNFNQEPMVLDKNFQIQGIVITTLPNS